MGQEICIFTYPTYSPVSSLSSYSVFFVLKERVEFGRLPLPLHSLWPCPGMRRGRVTCPQMMNATQIISLYLYKTIQPICSISIQPFLVVCREIRAYTLQDSYVGDALPFNLKVKIIKSIWSNGSFIYCYNYLCIAAILSVDRAKF